MISTAEVNTLDVIDKNKSADIAPVVEAQNGNGCHHYWLIERANGPESRAVCKYCHEERSFSNLAPEYGEQKIEGTTEKPGPRSHPFKAYELFGSKQRQASPERKEVANRSN